MTEKVTATPFGTVPGETANVEAVKQCPPLFEPASASRLAQLEDMVGTASGSR